MPYEVTVTHTIQLPDGYELAPGPQPRVPQPEDDVAGYKLAWGVSSTYTSDIRVAGLKINGSWIPFTAKYFLLRRKPTGVKLVFVDVRKFEDVPKGGFYGMIEGSSFISGATAKKNFDSKDYGRHTCDVFVAYYTTEPIYAPAS